MTKNKWVKIITTNNPQEADIIKGNARLVAI